MMKKLLTLIVVCTFGVFQMANAQVCTPDAQYAGNPGIYPDSATGLPHAFAGTAYSEVINVVIPSDTMVDALGTGTPIQLDIDSFVVTNVTGQPTGFTYACFPASCGFPGNTQGCLLLSGNPTIADTGTYPINVVVTPYVYHVALGHIAGPSSTIDDYAIVIDGPQAVETLNLNRFDVGQNIPNPTNGVTTINFSSPVSTTVDFKIFNLLGKIVYSQKIDAINGVNKIKYNTNELAQGVYVYSLTNGNTTVTKRMIVAGK